MRSFRFGAYVPRFTSISTLAVVLLTISVTPSNGQAARRRDGIRRHQRPVSGRYLVVLRSGDDPSLSAMAAEGVGRGRVRHIYRHAMRGFTIDTSEAAARAIAQDPAVAYVEQDGVVAVAGWESLGPDDNWGLDRIDQRSSLGDAASPHDGVYRYAADGRGVHVYVIDTGIRTTHAEFGGRAAAVFDVIGDGYGGGDCHGHGTHVAGIIGGARFGVAKHVTLHSVRAIGCDGSGSYSGVAAAIDWVVANHRNPAVINMSLGGDRSDSVDEAIRGAIASGIMFVGAAGNENDDSCSHLNGGVAEALVIGASGYTDWRESYSNFGACLDLFAPGGNITSAYAGNDTDSITMSGTSMASPHVAGAAALYLERQPAASPVQVAAAITGGATAGVIKDPVSSPNRILFTAYLGDITRPTISLAQPAAGSMIGGRQTLIAAPRDDVEIKKVIFLLGDVQLGSRSRAPYAMEWDTTTVPDGAYHVVARAYDTAGNSASAQVSVLVRNHHDKTPPRLTVEAQHARIWPPNGKLVPVTFTGTVSDDVSRISKVLFTVHDEYGRIQPSGSAAVTNGHFSIKVYLEASRRGPDADRRQYVMTVSATDEEGNRSFAVARAIVPHDH